MTLLQLAVNIACAAAGIVIGYLLARHQNKQLDKVDPAHAPRKASPLKVKNVIGFMLFVMAIFIVISTSQTNDRAKAIADQRATDAQIQGECNDEFFRVLSERTKITADDNELNRSDARALQQLVTDIFSEPSAFDPMKVAEAGQRYQQVVKANNAQREQNSIERAANPYPEPRCGN